MTRPRLPLIALALLAVVLIGMGGCFVGDYMGLINSSDSVNRGWARVNNQLQRRNELVGTLVELAGRTTPEKRQTLGDLAAARASLEAAGSREQTIEAGRTMDHALGRLFLVMESDPKVRSNETLAKLMHELAATEEALAKERMRYNEEVQGYNVLVKRFPTRLLAAAVRLREAPSYPRRRPGRHPNRSSVARRGRRRAALRGPGGLGAPRRPEPPD